MLVDRFLSSKQRCSRVRILVSLFVLTWHNVRFAKHTHGLDHSRCVPHSTPALGPILNKTTDKMALQLTVNSKQCSAPGLAVPRTRVGVATLLDDHVTHAFRECIPPPKVVRPAAGTPAAPSTRAGAAPAAHERVPSVRASRPSLLLPLALSVDSASALSCLAGLRPSKRASVSLLPRTVGVRDGRFGGRVLW